MLKQPITFQDFDGHTHTRDLYFNLTEWELIELETAADGKMSDRMKDAQASGDVGQILRLVKLLINSGYGERSPDGIYFEKSEAITKKFESSAMYSPLLLSLFGGGEEKVVTFINALMPAELVAAAAEKISGGIKQPQDFQRKQESVEESLPLANENVVYTETPNVVFDVTETPVVPGHAPTDNPEFQEFLRRRAAGEV